MTTSTQDGWSRRDFVLTSAALSAAVLAGAAPALARPTARSSGSALRVGVIGCGGRGTGAASDLLTASPHAEIVAMGDAFQDRLDASLAALRGLPAELSSRVRVDPKRLFVGFDAYQGVIDSDVDVVILATPPHFRPIHFAAAVDKAKHVFIEKPVAVDPAGVRKVLAAAEVATQKKLCVVAGTQRRHELSYRSAMERLKSGAIGPILGGSCYWNQGGLWMNKRKPGWTDVEWQMRNWLYFTWLSGDHIVEQHVHNIDVMNWAIGAHPIAARGSGGRQVRVSPEYGHVFDHFAIEFEYPGGVSITSMCRQIEGCENRVEEVIRGASGVARLAPGRAVIEGSAPWTFAGEQPNPYVE